MDQDRNREGENLDEDMERDTEIRRDTAIRGSLGQPHPNEESRRIRDEGMPEFEKSEVDDSESER